ncbi:hypothetical protein SLEP1_g9758 [Rubroshorea leprosula]|uniref:Protein kinase domain-containing protein n=3 Tax=Rubroshorea leprosula TaxID=152421 RepID=A0AAV5IBV4_9ROSI|nr:hypothetical protein SLEP1_g9758 [Rubroshorea leprosula]
MGVMGFGRSGVEWKNLKICAQVYVGFLLICVSGFAVGLTNPTDVAAINSLYTALGNPVLPGWIASGGDPCAEAWQGVQCNGSDIMRIILNGANLGGELSDNLGIFASIKTIDLSNNHIGGSIPSSLPVTMQNFFLSDNQFTGSIPDLLSSLTLLTDMSLNNNLLSGEIPDAFEALTGLINLDLSSNNLSGRLPPSMENLSRLTTLHLQANQISGTLDVLQDLPLRDLNIENNLFSGPIPAKMLNIPNFRNDGNPFNSTVALLPPTSPLSPPHAQPVSGTPPSEQVPTSGKAPGKHADGPSAMDKSSPEGKKKTTKRVALISIAVVLSIIVLALACLVFIPKCLRRREEDDKISKQHQVGAYRGNREQSGDEESLPTYQKDKVPKEVTRPKNDVQAGIRKTRPIAKLQNDQEKNVQRMSPPPPPTPPPPLLLPPPPPPTLAEKVIVKPSSKTPKLSASAKSFTIASLQQYTNSFSQENLIGGGMLGNVYRAELPNGKLLAVKKLHKKASSQQNDVEFIELVNNIYRIRHANVVELVGYCAEHGQRLLIYEYCSKGSLQDALHSDDDFKKNLSWNARIRIALGAARALEYLHEVCHSPVVHRNFKAANVLLDDELNVHVSECGLAPLIASGYVSQLSGNLLTALVYGAPDFETGNYTSKSDVYSFGVVMLELLTGRKSHDSMRNRAEQFLVRWAIPQLHDIDALSKMVDPSLNGEYPAKSLSHFADIISRCVQSQPEFRPLMSEVVQDLSDMIRRERQSNESIGD